MNILKLILSIITFWFITACKNKVTSVQLEKTKVQNSLYPFVLDYTYVGYRNSVTGEKDSLVISTPISFNLINRTKNDFQYKRIEQLSNPYFSYLLLNGKKYRGGDLKENIIMYSSITDKIIFYFETPISKKELEKDPKIKFLLNDEKQGDSILLKNLSSEVQRNINKSLSNVIFYINIKDVDDNKNIGIRYCFNKNKAIIYDVDSLVKANPRYMFSCDKDFYKKESN